MIEWGELSNPRTAFMKAGKLPGKNSIYGAWSTQGLKTGTRARE
jgi:hypothetical protein